MSVEEQVATLYGIDPDRVQDQTSSTRTDAQKQAQSAREQTQGYTEDDLLADVLTWARAQGEPLCYLLHIHGEAAGKTNAPGQLAGTPDLLLPYPSGEYHGLWLELKHPTRPGADLRPTQYRAMRRLHGAGYCTEIAWTFEQARYVLTCYVQTPGEALSGW